MSPKKPKIKIGINGFGGIGRLVARAALQRDDMQVVTVNDPFFYNEHVNHMYLYGINHGPWKHHDFDIGNRGTLLFDVRRPVKVFAYRNRALIPWAQTGAEYIVECSSEVIGKKNGLTDIENAYVHVKDGGAKKVIIAAYSEDAPLFVVGVNEHEYKSELDIVSAASRTTNCLAPLVKVIHDRFGIIEGLINTYHSLTGNQHTYDSNEQEGKSIISSNNNTAKAVGRVIPALNEKLTGRTFVIPTLDISVVDFIVTLEKATTCDEIKAAIKEESEGNLNGILGYIENDAISRGFIGDNRSCFFDAKAIIPLDNHVVKLTAWYNNEWGYSSRVVDLIAHMAKTC